MRPKGPTLVWGAAGRCRDTAGQAHLAGDAANAGGTDSAANMPPHRP